MKIAFFGVKASELDYLQANMATALAGHQVSIYNECLMPGGIPTKATDTEAISIFVACVADKHVLDSLPNLKLILARSTGYDNIDLAECKNRGIIVCNVPSYGEHTVAEYTFALILTLSRNIYEAVREVQDADRFARDERRTIGFDLYNKTLGVIGTGRIGEHVIKIAKGFGMNVVAHDVYKKDELAKELDFSYVQLDELLGTSDIVTLHVPYMKETHHLMNTESFSKLKRGAYLINTSRGGVVDTTALIEVLMSERLAGAGLDVLEDEHASVDKRLLDNARVIITPHTAFNTKEAIERILDTTFANIKSFASGTPQNIV